MANVSNKDITIEGALPMIQLNGLNTMTNINFNSGSNSCELPAATTINGSSVAGIGSITSSSTTAEAFGVTNTGVFTGTDVVGITANSATTGTVLLVTANGITTGHVVSITSSGTITTTGDVLSVTASGATTSTGVVRVTANSLTSGVALSLGALSALTTGQGIKIAHTTSVIADGGSLIQISSSSTDTGGATNGTLLDIKGTGQLAGTQVRVDSIQTTGTVMSVISTGVMTTTGNLLTLTANSATTAAGLFLVNANGLTSGSAAVIASSSADTTARNLLQVTNSGTASVGVIPVQIQNNAVTGTGSKFVAMMSFKQTSKTTTLWLSIDATTPNGNLTGTVGDVCFNGPSGRTFYCTGTTNWTASNA